MGSHPKSLSNALYDGHGRNFPYLRLSITDVCNFKCSYCLPNGYQGNARAGFLQFDEIERLVRVFSDLGTHKIRITGGEPTVRRDFTDIAKLIAANPKINQLAFTTNGYRLKDNAQKWRDAGLTHINVSVDSLNAERFHKITGHDRLRDVLDGIEAARKAGFKQVKINAVLLKGVNEFELQDMLDWSKDNALSIRFIELMQTGDNLEYFQKYHLSSEGIKRTLLDNGWTEAPRDIAAGPAQMFSRADHIGRVGIIAPYSQDFCKSCNRLRVTAKGDLRLCLFGDIGVSLRPLLQSDDQQDALKQLISKQLSHKAASHYLMDGKTGLTSNLSMLGG